MTETCLTAEARARRQIDVALEAAGWAVQDMKAINLYARSGVAVREYPVGADKATLDIFWLRDQSLEDADNLPSPDILASEIVEDLQAALTEFADIARSLSPDTSTEHRHRGAVLAEDW